MTPYPFYVFFIKTIPTVRPYKHTTPQKKVKYKMLGGQKIIDSDSDLPGVDSEEDIDNLLNTSRIQRVPSISSMSYARPPGADPEPSHHSHSHNPAAGRGSAYGNQSDNDIHADAERQQQDSYRIDPTPVRSTQAPLQSEAIEQVWKPNVPEISGMSNREVAKRKAELLSKARRYKRENNAEFNIPLSMNTPLDELEAEVQRVEDDQHVMNATTVGRNLIVSSITLLEFLNGKYNPFDLHLDGWSVDVKDQSDAKGFDEPIKKIYEKYKDKAQMAPEVQLILALGTSAVMCHFKKSLFQPKIAGLRDTIRQCPDIINNTVMPGPGNHQHTQQGVMSGPPNDVDDMIRDMMRTNPSTLPRDPAQGAYTRNPDAIPAAPQVKNGPVSDTESDLSSDTDTETESDYSSPDDLKRPPNTVNSVNEPLRPYVPPPPPATRPAVRGRGRGFMRGA